MRNSRLFDWLKSLLITSAILAVVLSACTNNKQATSPDETSSMGVYNEKFKSVPTYNLVVTDTIYRFIDDYPIALSIIDNRAIAILAKSDSALVAIDTSSGNLLWKSGHVGSGPNDVTSPDFMRGRKSDENYLYLYDYNAQRFISADLKTGGLEKEIMTKPLNESLNINQKDNRVVATPKNANPASMFYIYNRDTNKQDFIACPFEISENLHKKLGQNMINYILSTNVFANFDSRKIFVPFYMLDLVLVYDFNGKLLNQVSLTQSDISINSKIENLIDQKDYIGYSCGAIFGEFCYLKRNYFDGSSQVATEAQIVKFDGNGLPISIFSADNIIPISFDVAKDDEFYIIAQSELNSGDEIFYLLRMRKG
jgi:hypothetical protein